MKKKSTARNVAGPFLFKNMLLPILLRQQHIFFRSKGKYGLLISNPINNLYKMKSGKLIYYSKMPLLDLNDSVSA